MYVGEYNFDIIFNSLLLYKLYVLFLYKQLVNLIIIFILDSSSDDDIL